jgi:hypothetical protein
VESIAVFEWTGLDGEDVGFDTETASLLSLRA